jgi:hypothetical protein
MVLAGAAMTEQHRGMFRDAGAALAVLAIYVLTLLAPLHQAADLQRDLGKLGYETTSLWSLCTGLGPAGESDRPSVAKCPAMGVAKQDMLAVLPSTLAVELRTADTVLYGTQVEHRPLTRRYHASQPRAPPTLA